MIILGIDPGTAILGYGIIEATGNKLKLIKFGCFNTEKSMSDPARLKSLYGELIKLIKKYRPAAMAIERLFFFKNAKTVISVAQARGIILLAAENMSLPIYEFTPLEVKQAVTGYGRAEKQQIQKMVKMILGLKETPKPDDAADAVAIAICGAHCQAPKGLTP